MGIDVEGEIEVLKGAEEAQKRIVAGVRPSGATHPEGASHRWAGATTH